MRENDKLAVCIIGHPNSGKSETWYSLFGKKVHRGKYERELLVFEGLSPSMKEYVDIFLINGSPQESGELINGMIPLPLPKIVLCSLQYAEGSEYVEGVFGSIEWLETNGYKLYVLWLNPGYGGEFPYLDDLGLCSRIHRNDNNLIGRRNGSDNPESRAEEIRSFVHGWAKQRGLVY